MEIKNTWVKLDEPSMYIHGLGTLETERSNVRHIVDMLNIEMFTIDDYPISRDDRTWKTKLKDDSSNNADWVRDLRIILIVAHKNYVLDASLGMTKTIPEPFAMLKSAKVEFKKEHQVLMVNKTTSFKKKGEGKKGNFTKNDKQVATHVKKPKAGPKPKTECFYCKGNDHWKRNYLKYLVDKKDGKVNKNIFDIHVIDVYFTSVRSNPWVFDTGSVAEISNSKRELQNEGRLVKDEVTMCVGGHIGVKRMKKLHAVGFLESLDYESFDACEPCLIGKMTKTPFSETMERANDLLEIIHTDICGPMSVEARDGYRYFLTFTDDLSRYVYIYLMKHNSEIFEKFKKFQSKVKNYRNKKIKFLRSDHGDEYLSYEFGLHLKQREIVSQLTPSGTPQHNGMVGDTLQHGADENEVLKAPFTEKERLILRLRTLWSSQLRLTCDVNFMRPTTSIGMWPSQPRKPPQVFPGADFNLTCNDTAHSPRLYLRDGITQVISFEESFSRSNSIAASFSHTIPMQPGVSVYNLSLKLPGKSFSRETIILNITGCDLGIYSVEDDGTRLICSTVCLDPGIPEMAAMHNCESTSGCCHLYMEGNTSFHLKLVNNHSKSNIDALSNHTSKLWDRINIASDGPSGLLLWWQIVDQSNCVAAKKNRADYACISEHAECFDGSHGYSCMCSIGYTGNPYFPDGCSKLDDRGYNPIPSRADCTRWCGNASVQFPFGLEEGCFASEDFHLNCTNTTSSAALILLEAKQVIGINIDEGTVNITSLDQQGIYSMTENFVFPIPGSFSSAQWVAANLSCLEAQQNSSRYACVSINSKCVEVSVKDLDSVHRVYVGYRCKCSDGFQGNPYIQTGCQDLSTCLIRNLLISDINECLQPNKCKGICHNTKGSFSCTECPRKTEYDPLKMQCTKRQQPLLLALLIRRWKRNVQKQLRKNYFRKNQGLLLETLISSDETANENTKIFPLEELEKATNNFDPTRIIGRGGHGMVYKGILSDQRVVAIKKSKIIKQCEISQFINEVAVLSQINHRNIVKLFGCCLETEVPLLVYEYVSSGSLSQVLHADSNKGFSLAWADHLRIAQETAGALSYLHSSASISIFHRDVKSSNILLDGNYTAKVSDFGASRLVPIDQTHIVTNVRGTFGYLDPEYFHTRKLNEKSDVYSFGVVLVELLLRMKPVFSSESGTIKGLSNYFLQEFNEGRITGIANSQVIEEATEEEISTVASLAERCLRLHGEERPTMKQVETELQTLRTKRMNSSQPDPSYGEQMQARPLTQRSRSSRQSSVRPGGSQRRYSLEAEFLSSASLPR
uniref:Wall-associated receptor kinase 5 n=1 Tax=Aegilops tauschii TaxID=37682 RepID=M8ASV7_AEGTA